MALWKKLWNYYIKQKTVKKNTLENYYIQFLQHDNTIIKVQAHLRTNQLFQIAYDIQSRDTNTEPPIWPHIPTNPVSLRLYIKQQAHGYTGMYVNKNKPYT